jgi:hypothetical protein
MTIVADESVDYGIVLLYGKKVLVSCQSWRNVSE